MSILDQNAPTSPEATDRTGGALGAIRPHLACAFGFTAVVNVLFLSSPLYMMQIYGRVLNSRSLETLVSISIALALALVLLGAADAARGRLLALLDLRALLLAALAVLAFSAGSAHAQPRSATEDAVKAAYLSKLRH